jgi:hypothetical protein
MRTGLAFGTVVAGGVAAALSASSIAEAYVVTIGGTAVAGNGQISSRLKPTYTEGFDEYGSACNTTVPLGPNPQGQFIISATSTRGVRGAPAGDTSCYASVGFGSGSFAFFNGVQNLSYFGLYWGSVDAYNQVQILGSDYRPLTFTAGSYTGTVLTGAIIASAFGLTGAPSVYVNFDFASNENAVQYLIQSITNSAFEYDNLAGSVRPPLAASQLRAALLVSEPGALVLMGVSVMALGIARRQRRALR